MTPIGGVSATTTREFTPSAPNTLTDFSTSTPTPLADLTSRAEFSPSPTAPNASDTPTASPEATAATAASAVVTATVDTNTTAWSQQAHEIQRINGALADAGRGYQAGTLSQGQAMTVLTQADQDAAVVTSTTRTLPPPTGSDAATVAQAQQAVATWSSTLHSLRQAAENMDFFSGIPLAGKLQTDAQNVNTAMDRLRLPA